jgi:hypothetical protein
VDRGHLVLGDLHNLFCLNIILEKLILSKEFDVQMTLQIVLFLKIIWVLKIFFFLFLA